MINKIRNSIFFKSTLILLFGGTLTRIVGFILKIIITRKIGTYGIGIYSMLGPTIALFTTISIFSYPTAMSTLVSKNKYINKDLIYSTLIFSLIINIFLIIIIILLAPYISNTLLKNNIYYLPIICISFTLPFISISSIIKGYFWGKQNMFPYMLSNFIEQIIRLVLILLFIDYFINNNIIYSICYIILVNVIGEIVSELIMICFIPRGVLKHFKPHFNMLYINNTLKIIIPSTSSKLIGSISYFLEPIILTNILLYLGYTKEFITSEYGIINAYALSLLLMPQFFTQNMSTALIPELSKHYSLKNYDICKKRIKQIILISVFIGSISTLIILLFPKFFLNILYNTTKGIDYIKLIAPFTILFYIEYPLIGALNALNQSKKAMYSTIIGSIIRLSSIVIFSLLGFGMYSLILSIIINLIVSTLIYYLMIRKVLK